HNAWSQIEVQLKRRYDLIPNLVNTVKGYMKHERRVLENVTKMRAALVRGSPAQKAAASNQITEALKSIFAVAENYPQLKANENFKHLQEELSGTESKVAYARQFYNDSVMQYNEALQVFPKNIFAKLFNFQPREFFETKGKEREAVKVTF
ncbi:MAG TPA: LemA family protein, partial [Candidatus Nanoarchaeia archaeon]|nr:LemA family protein [Candidatus Nanoarchaeia archaeon]